MIETPYNSLSESDRKGRALWAATAMRELRPLERKKAIEASPNVIDGRSRFTRVIGNIALAWSHSGPQEPDGAA